MIVITRRYPAAMTLALWAACTVCTLATAIHLITITIAIVRCRAPRRHLGPPPNPPPISIIRPVCGVDNHAEVTLASAFTLDYPHYEILFCAASARDPAVPLVQALIAAHPDVPARLLIGDERISANPKLNNVLKGWRAACHDLIVMADSNVLMPRDYIQRMLACWRPDTGLVSSPPVGSDPQGFWAGFECAFLNAYQVRWQYVADTVGLGFAQGKTLFYRRSDIEAAGGLRALAAEAAEDAATTKLVRAAGRRVRLVDAPFEQPLGRRARADVWHRQVRWARLRRDSFPFLYWLELTAGSVLPLAAAAFVAFATGYPEAFASYLALWYGAEMTLYAAVGWRLPLLYPLHALLRDASLPLLWLEGFRGRGFIWRGNAMNVDEADEAKPA
jgi:ceramide glucosyltransferase